MKNMPKKNLSLVMDKTQNTKTVIDTMVENAKVALDSFMSMTQEQVDSIVQAMTLAGIEHHMRLAKLAVDETKRGVYEDKIIKNLFATEYIYNNIKNLKTVGVIQENDLEDYIQIAEPVGIIAGVTPVTNPTSTTMFKALISIKTRNPVIFAFHPSAQVCSSEAARIMRDAAVQAGAPEHCIQWIEQPALEATQYLMNHPGVSLVLATGGSGMVKAAYSTGKPALGVGPGNVPCYIEKTANIKRAVTDLILSKTFDNGMICASEQAVIIDQDIAQQVIEYMKENKCYFLNEEETERIQAVAIDSKKGMVNAAVVGKPASEIAKMAGIIIPKDTKILVAKLEGVGPEYPLSGEKLSPILAMYIVKDYTEGIQTAEQIVEFGGLGHSAVIHSENPEVIDLFARRIKAGRLIVNSPSSQGAIGDIYNTNMPSLTLGCGSYGHNSTTANVSAVNLINIKRMAKRRVNMQWFKVPKRIYFEPNSIQYLEKMPEISRAFIVTAIILPFVIMLFKYLAAALPMSFKTKGSSSTSPGTTMACCKPRFSIRPFSSS
jgi:acetaldehyde dehydrogenase/alcohol dehydrogenase